MCFKIAYKSNKLLDIWYRLLTNSWC